MTNQSKERLSALEVGEREMAEAFVAACAKPLHLTAKFAAPAAWGIPTMAKVLGETLDYDDFEGRLLQLLCDAVQGKHVQAEAAELLEDMATKYASLNAEVSA